MIVTQRHADILVREGDTVFPVQTTYQSLIKNNSFIMWQECTRKNRKGVRV
ncbi:hypothetical protein ACIAD1542 [Acinetobacter baylyi ADP1]|uniref:Uncharacterized protein n=1 Tax=Acinetobacter baylyi (strain ATCC 33305 / BD413 / ADP1) TaxID=62977 RepID=Q6FC16_ACIAD|nr:hypothetical protein ACIAD1542 [Acinetobacter baylyi ADP1]